MTRDASDLENARSLCDQLRDRVVAKVVEAEGEAGQARAAKCVPELALGCGRRVLRRPDGCREHEIVWTAPARPRFLLEQNEPGAAEHGHDALARRRLRRRDDPSVVRRDDMDEPLREVDGLPPQRVELAPSDAERGGEREDRGRLGRPSAGATSAVLPASG
jgi:hypothetical protein